MDAGRCIANLPIENRGAIPLKLRSLVGDWVFGCDICQEVCPYNRGRSPARNLPQRAADPWPEFSAEGGAGTRVPLQTLLGMGTDAEAFQRFAGTPLLRAKRSGLLRNAAVAAGNSQSLQLTKPLINLLHSDPDPLVRAHSAWALGRIGTAEATGSLSQALWTEQNPSVLQEIRATLQT